MKRGAETLDGALGVARGSSVGGSDSMTAGVALRVVRGRQSKGECQTRAATGRVRGLGGDREMPVVAGRENGVTSAVAAQEGAAMTSAAPGGIGGQDSKGIYPLWKISPFWEGRCRRCGLLDECPWTESPEKCAACCPICKGFGHYIEDCIPAGEEF